MRYSFRVGEEAMKDMPKPETLGIVIPVYHSTETVRILLEQLSIVLEPLCSYHVYLVDDSADAQTSAYLKKHCLAKKVTLITLKQNSGQQNAVLCGLRLACRHPAVLTMDDDLQHPPELIPALYRKLSEGFDLVYALPENRDKNLLRYLGSRLRDVLFPTIRVSSFRIMTGEIAQRAASFQGHFFYFSAEIFKKSPDKRGLRTASLVYQRPARSFGRSGYSLKKLITLYGKLLIYYGPLSILTAMFKKESKPLYEIKENSPALMVLGGSNCQIHALERARERSIFTVLADYTKNPPAKELADIHEPISTFDAPACIEAAKRHQIQGVMTLGTDQPVLTAALTAKALGLPSFLTESEARSVTNKKQMKQILSQNKIKTARYLFLSRDGKFYDTTGHPAEFTLQPPYVLKPLDSQGQRGIFKLYTKEAILEKLPETLSFSREDMALVEEFYESDEITVSGWINNRTLTILTITDRLLYPDSTHIGVCIGHRFPSIHMGRYGEIRRICNQLVTSFSLENGPFYLQLLIGGQGIFVNELACRIGGAFEDVTIPYLTGFSILDAVIDGALGYPVSFPLAPDFRCDKADKASFVLLLFCRPGKIAHITDKDSLLSLPYVLDCGFNYAEGSRIPVMKNATARFGHAVLVGTKESLARDIKDFYNRLQVLDENERNLLQTFEEIHI